MTIDLDDFGANHVISDMCQSHDCRKELDKLHYANPAFKVTLFAIPGEMTPELLMWCIANSSWVELAVHGFWHRSNYETEKLSYEQFDAEMNSFIADAGFFRFFASGFKSPGWQTSSGTFDWLDKKSWWVSCQNYDADRIPPLLPAYVNYNGEFKVHYKGQISEITPSYHGHTWATMGNGVEEQLEMLIELVKRTQDFKFVSEVIEEFKNEVDSAYSK